MADLILQEEDLEIIPKVKDLSILTRPLGRDQIEFRAAQASKDSKGQVWCSILAYKTARTDMQVLDDAVGQMNWQVRYERDSKGILQCSIGIWDETKNMGSGDWVWKSSNGTESDFESEKGEYSDAFKRAGFMWGIGRQLYDFVSIWVILNDNDYYEKDGRIKVSPRLRPNDWIWEISDDYKDVTAKRVYGNEKKIVFQSNPYGRK